MKNFVFTKTTTLKLEIQAISDLEEKQVLERQIEAEEIWGFISVLRKDVSNFKKAVKSYSKTPEYLDKISKMTQNIESKFNKFKLQQMQKFDGFLEQEEELLREIDLINNHIEYYEAPAQTFENMKHSVAKKSAIRQCPGPEFRDMEAHNSDFDESEDKENIGFSEQNQAPENIHQNTKSTALAAIQKKMNNIKKEIDAVDSQISSLGDKNLGWESEDHALFLKLRTKHKNNIQKMVFLQDCVTSLPFLGEEEIKRHIENFKKFLELEERKKTLVQEYKAVKEEHKKAMISNIETEEKAQTPLVSKAKVQNVMKEQEKELVKEELKRWKAEKQARMELEKEKKQMEVAMRRKQEASLLQAKKSKISEQLEEFKAQKEVEKMRKKEKEEYEKSLQKRMITPQDSIRLREREELTLQKKLENIEKKKQAKQEKEERQKKLLEEKSYKFAYVDSKLDDETTAAKTKKRDKFDIANEKGRAAETFGGHVVRFTGRAIPMWRQGV